jgi:outer membrane protein insertion porin family
MHKIYKSRLVVFLSAMLLALPLSNLLGQETPPPAIFDYENPVELTLDSLMVEGAEYSDSRAILARAGLRKGMKIKIPGNDISRAIKNLWKLRLFTEIDIVQFGITETTIDLKILVKERPRLSKHSFKGVKKGQHDDLNEIVDDYLVKGGIITDNMLNNTINGLRKNFVEKGYLDTDVTVKQTTDSKKRNTVKLQFTIDKKEKVKIRDIVFTGNDNLKGSKLRKRMKETKPKKRFLASSKYIKDLYEDDKKAVIAYYNTLGFRDAQILSDSLWRAENGELMIQINLNEGNRYFFRNISWKGNSIYDDETLEKVLGIAKGDPYNQELLDTRMSFSQDGRDVSSLYLDNGYLFFRGDPTEVAIVGDSIDLEIRIFEGPQATIDKVTVMGNDRTHEHVIRRELRTLPGSKFSRSDIIRSQREIMNLGYFNAENLQINTPVNPQRGTVDIEYTVEERPSDQLELSAGWGGAGRGVIGTLGVSFNNFSLRNLFEGKAWSPLPQGDGQRLSLRAQTNGRFYQSYNLSFTEPWLGGKKPNAFTFSSYYTRWTTGDRDFGNFGRLGFLNFSVGLGTRLRWPDDNFISNTAINFQVIQLLNWQRFDFPTPDGQYLQEGNYNNFSIRQTFARSTVNDPIFPKNGSRFELSVQFTPPYSLFKKDNFWELTNEEIQRISDNYIMEFGEPASEATLNGLVQDAELERYNFLEYHKWRFNAEWYLNITGNLVLKASAKFGVLGLYSKNLGQAPFERYRLGGDGISGQSSGFAGFDLISLRGYDLSDVEASDVGGAALFDKLSIELRYPLSLNPTSTIYVLGFLEGGNSWKEYRDFKPFDFKRSVGMGLRVFLPMFGVLGFDYGIGFDKPFLQEQGAKWSDYATFNIILGFEPE